MPSFWMKNKHLQTLYQTFFRRIKKTYFEVEEFILEDGDFLESYWLKTQNSKPTTPLVVIFHGLAGSYKSPYINGIMHALTKVGYNTVLMHFRGCSGKVNTLPRSYHSGETGDALYFLDSLQKRFPDAKHFAIGYSLGGNMLLKLLGELQKDSHLSGAVSISPPMQLDVCANAIHQGFSRVYERHLVHNLNKALLKKYAVNDIESDIGLKVASVKKLKTFWEFDTAYTAPIHGFESAQDYYTKSSSRQFLKDIHTPTLIIHSIDDPFMSTDMIPKKDEMSKSVHLELTQYGGHVGFIEGSIFKPRYWLESRIVDFFNEELDSKN